MSGAVQEIKEVRLLTNRKDGQNGHYVVTETGPFVNGEAAQEYIKSHS